MSKLLKKENRYLLSLLGIAGTGITITAGCLSLNTVFCDQVIEKILKRYR